MRKVTKYEHYDKEKNTFLAEDISNFTSQKLDEDSYNYASLESIVELYYQRYQESLRDRRQLLNTYVFDFDKDEFIKLSSRETILKMKLQKQTIKEKL